ncbi:MULTISPECIES: hypothetical protein [Okeania]|nr:MULTISPECIES: hypothetical protein [Okeania]
MKKEEGRRKKKWMGIVFDKPLRVYNLQPIVNTPVDGGVLNPK